MSRQTERESVADERRAWPLPVFVRAAIYAGCWAPLFVLMTFFVPRFSELFARLEARGELPGITAWLIWFGEVNERTLYAPCLLFLILVVAVDAAVARSWQRSRRGRLLYWLWFGAVIVMGYVMLNLAAVALVLPVFMMSATL